MNTAQSSHINRYLYEPESRSLDLEFTNGAIYRFSGVDPNTYYAFAQSSSKGSYFHSKIKANFSGTLLSPGAPKRRNQ